MLMKWVNLVLLLPVIVIIVSGCTSTVSSEETKQILETAINNSASFSSYTASYVMSMNFDVSGNSFMTMSGDFDSWRMSDKTKISGEFVVSLLEQSQNSSMSIYYLPDATYMCDDETAVCLEYESELSDLQAPEKAFEELLGFVDEDAVILSYLGTKQIAGRICDNIKATLDPNKISVIYEQLPSDMLTPEVMQAIQNVDIYESVCLDRETGFVLEFITNMNMQATVQGQSLNIISSIQMTATSMEPNVVIDDSVFDLPYEVGESYF